MTQLVSDAPVSLEGLRHKASARSIVEHVAGLGAPAIDLSYLVHGTGGRELRPLTVTIVLTAVAFAVLRAWRQPKVVLVLAGWTIAAAYAVALIHAPGAEDPLGHAFRWHSAGGYALAAMTFLTCRAYVVDRPRAHALAIVAAGATCLQFAWAFTPWWGGGEPAPAMFGTFYWYNQYAIFLYPGVVLGLAIAFRNRRPWRFVGWAAVALGGAGIVYSTSRATLVIALASLAAVTLFALIRSAGSRRWVTVVAVACAAATSAVVLAMCHPPLVDRSSSPFTAEQARTTAGQSVGTNGGYRVDFWREAAEVALHHPVDGAGYGELATSSRGLVPASYPTSPLAHNGLLQPFADGGLLLGLPVLLGVLAAGFGSLRRLNGIWRRRDVGSFAAVVTVGGLVLHSVVDFDWSYPALWAAVAILAAVATAPSPSASDAPAGRPEQG